MKYLKLYENFQETKLDKDILNSISSKLPNMNHTGSPICALFALKVRDFLYKKIGKLYPLVILFGVDDDVEVEHIPTDVDYIFNNKDKFYLSHVLIDIDGELYDSDGFTNMEFIKKDSDFVIRDESGDITEKLLTWEDSDFVSDYESDQMDSIFRLYETYSADKEEIVDFMESLPNNIKLYRGLIIEKGDDIDKENLGINWTLDEYFAKNIFEYESFGGGSEMEDYNLWIVTAMFNKSDIDYDGTIDKRLIKDGGFFWDEITGEMIENDNMDYHPYSHEDEILVKKSSTPKIINIEKIDLLEKLR